MKLSSWRWLLVAVVAMTVSAGASSQPAWSPEQLMRDLAAVQEAELSFVEYRTSVFLVDQVRLTGTLLYRAPDFIEKSVTTPYVRKTTIDGDTVFIEKQTERGEVSSRRYLLTDSVALNMAVEGIRATLSGDLDTINRHFDMEMQGDRANWSVQLLPRTESMRELIEKISLSGSHDKISVIDTTNADGDESRLTLSYLNIR